MIVAFPLICWPIFLAFIWFFFFWHLAASFVCSRYIQIKICSTWRLPQHTHTQKGGGFSLILSQYVCINYGRCTHLIFLFPKGEQAAKEKKKKKKQKQKSFLSSFKLFRSSFFFFSFLFKQMRATKRCFDVHSPYKTSRCFCHVCPEERLVMGKKNKNKNKRKEKKKMKLCAYLILSWPTTWANIYRPKDSQ